MTPRGTDWSLALLVSLLFASGLATWFSGDEGSAWVFAAHAIAAGALALRADDLTMVTWDHDLSRAAARSGCAVAPAL